MGTVPETYNGPETKQSQLQFARFSGTVTGDMVMI